MRGGFSPPEIHKIGPELKDFYIWNMSMSAQYA